MTRLVSLLGLGFGDCGKGLFTDFLARHWQAHTVMRFNGGAQAGHNVVLPDGRHHTFSQFCAATFVPGVATVLAAPVVVHPGALLVENRVLQQSGVADALQRLLIDGRCRISTPFHQAAGRLRELLRGADTHGTCGVGVGATVQHGLQHPQQILHYADLSDANSNKALAKLDACRQTLLAEFPAACPVPGNAAQYDAERQMLLDPGISGRWLAQIEELRHAVAPASPVQLRTRLQTPGTVLFEGAQGVLLDEWRGFHPHTTWSTIHPDAVRAVLADLAIHDPVQHFGILRSYMTRHGQGPLPTHDPALNLLAEPHNHAESWQGEFRRGHVDAVLLRYALQVCGPLDGLLLSHLDVFDKLPGLNWCDSYQFSPSSVTNRLVPEACQAATSLRHLPLGKFQDLEHQAALTALLDAAIPEYDARPLNNANDLIGKIAALANCPVILASFGPTHLDVQILAPEALT